jgi:hypothetical protein
MVSKINKKVTDKLIAVTHNLARLLNNMALNDDKIYYEIDIDLLLESIALLNNISYDDTYCISDVCFDNSISRVQACKMFEDVINGKKKKGKKRGKSHQDNR